MAYEVTQNPKNKKNFFVQNQTTGRVVGHRGSIEEAQKLAALHNRKEERTIRHHGLDKATVSIHTEE